jgi:hypothetical protein
MPIKMSMEDWWNDNDKEKPNVPKERKLFQCHTFYHRSHMAGLGLNWSLQGKRPAMNQLSHGMAPKQIRILQAILSTHYTNGVLYFNPKIMCTLYI